MRNTWHFVLFCFSYRYLSFSFSLFTSLPILYYSYFSVGRGSLSWSSFRLCVCVTCCVVLCCVVVFVFFSLQHQQQNGYADWIKQKERNTGWCTSWPIFVVIAFNFHGSIFVLLCGFGWFVVSLVVPHRRRSSIVMLYTVTCVCCCSTCSGHESIFSTNLWTVP